MNLNNLHNSLAKNTNRHIFSRFRKHIRLWASIVFLSFGLFDYLYAPEHFAFWMSLRFVTVLAVILFFQLIVKIKALRKNMSYCASAALCMYCWPIAIMIYQSGGYSSLYSTGLILCGTTGLQVFRLRNKFALASLTLSYLPAMIIYFVTVPIESINLAILQSGFLLGMMILSYIYGTSEEQVDRWWLKFKSLTNHEIHRLQKTEILKNHFPKVIRDVFEKNPEKIYQRKILPNAVVGFTDIVASSQISNLVPLAIDWEIKEKFLEAATRRAIASEMVVLTHLGDGFLFLANYDEGSQWYYNLISFYEGLITDFKKIALDLNLQSTGIATGVKFGVSSGPVMVGFLGRGQSYFTAIGPDVNLAARLCALAEPDQIVLSTRVWHSIKPLLVGWNFKTQVYDRIKGFDYTIAAVHIFPRSTQQSSMICATCNGGMSLVKTEDGFMDYRCAEGHNTPKLSLTGSNTSAA